MLLFYLLVLSLPLTQHYALAYRIGGITVEKLLGAACIPVVLVQLVTKGVSARALGQKGALLCMSYFVLAMFSYVFSHGVIWDGLGPQNNVFSILLLLVLSAVLVDSVERLHWTFLMSVGSVAIASVYVIREWLEWGHSIPGYRPGGVSGDANYFGTAAAACLPMAFALMQGRRAKWEKAYLIVCFIITLIAFFLAASRGGLIGLLVGFLLVFTKSRSKLRNIVLATALVVPLLAVAPNSPVERLLNPDYGDQMAVAARETTWRAGWRMFAAYPVIGIGLARFKTVVLNYEDGRDDVKIQSLAHNTYIEVAAEQGLLGFLPFIGTLVAAYMTLGKIARITTQLEPTFLYQACVGLQAALVAAWVGAFFISAWWFRFYWFPVFLAFCVQPIAATALRKRREALSPAAQTKRKQITHLDWAPVDANS